MKTSQFIAKRVYSNEKGIHIEFATEAEAKECYEDSIARGISSNELDGNVVIKRFPKAVNLSG